jgi:hypothetical protein
MSPKPITDNTLFYGDNLPILRENIGTESVDLQASPESRAYQDRSEGA